MVESNKISNNINNIRNIDSVANQNINNISESKPKALFKDTKNVLR